MRFTAILALLVAVPWAAPVRADCACLCVDGAIKTVCADAGAARDHPTLCAAEAGRVCPAVPETTAPPKRYAAPVDGVAHCRDALVYDTSTGGYVTEKVCDAEPGQARDARPG